MYVYAYRDRDGDRDVYIGGLVHNCVGMDQDVRWMIGESRRMGRRYRRERRVRVWDRLATRSDGDDTGGEEDCSWNCATPTPRACVAW